MPLCQHRQLALVDDLIDRTSPTINDVHVLYQPTMALPGRPERPPLVPPSDAPHRSMATPEGRAALIHAICQIQEPARPRADLLRRWKKRSIFARFLVA